MPDPFAAGFWAGEEATVWTTPWHCACPDLPKPHVSCTKCSHAARPAHSRLF